MVQEHRQSVSEPTGQSCRLPVEYVTLDEGSPRMESGSGGGGAGCIGRWADTSVYPRAAVCRHSKYAVSHTATTTIMLETLLLQLPPAEGELSWHWMMLQTQLKRNQITYQQSIFFQRSRELPLGLFQTYSILIFCTTNLFLCILVLCFHANGVLCH